ncbi:MAG: thiamine diphosphokinase [Lachnospiraceae bacterium]|nr:thiamine diphosphokinase [Lachnospiraceae bacterium]
MTDKKCIVIGAGDLTVGAVNVGEEDLVIAVDGGINYCGILEIEPDIILGDFDSVNEAQREAILNMKEQAPDRVIALKPEKDDTDMLAALKLGLEMGYDDFLIYGATGGRLEHTLANIQCLLYLKNHDAVGYLMDGSGMIFVIKNEEVKLRDNLEGYFSLFCLGKEAKGVTIKGMKYELEDYTMTNDFPIGVSNEFIGKEASVSVKDGELVGIVNYVSDEVV